MIHEASGERLRDIDPRATACLELAARKKARVVERDIAVRIVRDVGFHDLDHVD